MEKFLFRYTAGTHTFYGGSTAFENDVYINKGNLYLNGDTDQNNGCIQFGDGKWQCTSAGALDDIIEWNISTIETSLVGITGCGLSCTGVTGDLVSMVVRVLQSMVVIYG